MHSRTAGRMMEILGPNKEQKERMFREICRKYQGQPQEKRPKNRAGAKRFRAAVAVAAAVCILLTTTAVAAEYWKLDLGFLEFLKPGNSGEEEYLAQGVCTVDREVAQENGILTVKQVIGDSNLLCILMDFTAPEGIDLDADRVRFDDSSFDVGLEFYSADFRVLENNGGDHKISMVMSVLSKNIPQGDTAHLTLRDLQTAGPYPEKFQTVAAGNWEISFPLDFQRYSSERQVDLDVSLYGYPAQVKSVEVSPISVTLKVDSPNVREISEAGQKNWVESAPDVYRDNYPVTLYYKDGSSETTEFFNGLYQADYRSGEMLFIKTFEQAVQDRAIRSIEFFGVEIPVDQ